MIPSLIGASLAAATYVYAVLIGLSMERAFYTTMLIVVALYYVLFAAMGGESALLPESLITVGFAALASIGFKRSAWLLAAGLAAHGLLDLVHGSAVSNPGVPAWWPPFCAAYDLTMAAFLAMSLWRHRTERVA